MVLHFARLPPLPWDHRSQIERRFWVQALRVDLTRRLRAWIKVLEHKPFFEGDSEAFAGCVARGLVLVRKQKTTTEAEAQGPLSGSHWQRGNPSYDSLRPWSLRWVMVRGLLWGMLCFRDIQGTGGQGAGWGC